MAKKLLITLITFSVFGFLFYGVYSLQDMQENVLLGAPASQATRDLIPDNDSERYIGTTTPSTLAYLGIVADEVCLTGDVCRTTWPGSSSSSAYDAWTHPVAGDSATTSQMIFNSASSTFTDRLNVGYIMASSTATSTFAGGISSAGLASSVGLTVNGTGFVVNQGVPANSFIVNANGNVGIGTTTPQALLSLAEGTTAAGGIKFGSDTYLYRDGIGQLTLAGNTSATNHGVLAITNSDSNEN